MPRSHLTFELPVSILEELITTEFNLMSYLTMIDIEWDDEADALYLHFTVDSGDLERIPESSSIGCVVDT